MEIRDSGEKGRDIPELFLDDHGEPGHEASIVVPLPTPDSTENEPPESSARSLMLTSPKLRLRASGEDMLAGSNPLPLSSTAKLTRASRRLRDADVSKRAFPNGYRVQLAMQGNPKRIHFVPCAFHRKERRNLL